MDKQEKEVLLANLTVEKVEDTFDANDPMYNVILGGRDLENPPDWEGYLEYFKEEAHPYLEVLKKYVTSEGLLGSTGQDLNNDAFKFSDGTVYGFTWRAWGDFMQAVVGEREGYMTYYM